MANLVLPQVLVFQQFRALSAELTEPLRALIVGPEYQLHRYATAAEKELAGTINPAGDTVVTFASLTSSGGGTVDTSFTSVTIENALLEYWNGAAAETFKTEVATPTLLKASASTISDSTGFVRTAAEFPNRGVNVGDTVRMIASGGETHDASVIGFTSSATVPAAASGEAADAGNLGATTATSVGVPPTITADGGNVGDAVLKLVVNNYDGTLVGLNSDVYTIECTKAPTDITNPTTARFNITTASGLDDSLGFVPVGVAIGDNELLGALGAEWEITSIATSMNVGDKWSITVQMTYAAIVFDSTDTDISGFTGTKDTTYIVEVTRGGATTSAPVAGQPLITVTTNNGVDGKAASPISGVADAQAFPCGTQGAVIRFGQTVLAKGEKFSFAVAASGLGKLDTAILDQALPATHADGANMQTVQWCTKRNQTLPAVTDAVNNYTHAATTLTVHGLVAQDFDNSWSTSTALPIIGGNIYLTWRELLSDHADRVYTIETTGDLATVFSTQNSPDNPLYYGVFKALQNSGSATQPAAAVRFLGVPTDDVAGYTSALAKSEGRDDFYTIVPLSFDKTVHDLVAAHTSSLSTAETSQWRVGLVCSEEVNPAPIAKLRPGGETIMATTTATTLTLDTASATDVNFLTLKVKKGDTIRLNFGPDAHGVTIWNERTVTVTPSQTNQLTLNTGAVELAAIKVEIYRTLDPDDSVEHIGDKASAFASSRIYNIYPSTVLDGGVSVPGYFLAAAIGGLIGASAPQQGLTNVQISGFDNMNNVVDRFSRSQLDTLANKGVWIVVHDLQSGAVHTRRQLSTNVTDLNTAELSIVKNVDSISYLMRNRLKRFIGRANVTPQTLEIMRTELEGALSFLASNATSPVTGGQILPGTAIRELRAHTLLADRVVIIIDLVIPFPLNNIELFLVI